MVLEEKVITDYLYNNVLLNYNEVIEITYKTVDKYIDKVKASRQEKERWKILNKKYRKAFLSNKRTHLFRTCTGSGKTVTSVLWVKVLTRLYETLDGFLVLSYEYEHGTNEIESIILRHGKRIEFIRFEGKNRLCRETESIINDRGDTIKDLMKYGVSIKPYCEKICEQKDSCIYIHNCKTAIRPKKDGGIKNIITVHHQLGKFIPIYLMHVNNVMLVLDEDFTDGIKINNRYGVPTLKNNIKFLNLVIKELNKRMIPTDDLFRVLVEDFKLILEEFLKNIFDINTPLDYEKIDDYICSIDIIIGESNHYLEVLDNFAYEFIKSKKIKPFKFIFGSISNFIRNYEYEKMNDEKDPNMSHFLNWRKQAYFKVQDKFIISFLYYDKQLIERLVNKENIDKIIINDATANINILNNIFGNIEPIEEHNEDWLYSKCKIYQLKKIVNKNKHGRKYAHYPKSSFYYENTFKYLMNDVRQILNKHKDEPVLIVSREISGKKLIFNGGVNLSDYVHSLGHHNILFDEYPLAGTNIYSNVNVVIILGKPDLPNSVVKRQSTLIGMDIELYRNSYSKNQILQAMGRILRGYEQKYIYILTGFDLELKQKITTFKSHSKLKEHIKEEIKQKEEKEKFDKIYKKIMNFLEKNKKIDIRTFMEMTKKTRYSSDKILKNLVKNKLLRKERGKKNKIFYFI